MFNRLRTELLTREASGAFGDSTPESQPETPAPTQPDSKPTTEQTHI